MEAIGPPIGAIGRPTLFYSSLSNFRRQIFVLFSLAISCFKIRKEPIWLTDQVTFFFAWHMRISLSIVALPFTLVSLQEPLCCFLLN